MTKKNSTNNPPGQTPNFLGKRLNELTVAEAMAAAYYFLSWVRWRDEGEWRAEDIWPEPREKNPYWAD